jgi:hypothetical protein
MVTFGRVLLWTVVLLAPGGFLLVPVLAAASLRQKDAPKATLREQLSLLVAEMRKALGGLQRHWTKS